jgi:hypothetical protein
MVLDLAGVGDMAHISTEIYRFKCFFSRNLAKFYLMSLTV